MHPIILQIIVTARGNIEINGEPNVRVLALSIKMVAVVITGKYGGYRVDSAQGMCCRTYMRGKRLS